MKRTVSENPLVCCPLCETVRLALQMEHVVKDPRTAVLTHTLMSRAFGYLSKAQRGVIIEAVMLTVVPPSEVPDADREALRRKLLTLPWAWELSAGTADGLVDRSGVRMSHLEDPRLLGKLGRAIARDIRSTALRESVVRVMILLAGADGGDPASPATFAPLFRAMQIPATRAARIFRDLQSEVARAGG